ncbi:MAG: 30S ribosomal protein S1 [Bryobacterales bacterium]
MTGNPEELRADHSEESDSAGEPAPQPVEITPAETAAPAVEPTPEPKPAPAKAYCRRPSSLPNPAAPLAPPHGGAHARNRGPAREGAQARTCSGRRKRQLPRPLREEPAAEAQPKPAAPSQGFVPGLPAMPAAGDAAEEDEEIPAAEEQMFQEALLELSAEMPDLREGDRRSGIVVSVGDDGVVVDIGAKTEGFLSSRGDRPEALAELQPGQEIEVVVARLGEPGEYVQVALAQPENDEAWETLEAAYRDKQTVTGKVIERVKGGLTMDVGLPAFLPGSQADLRAPHDLDAWIGQEIEVRIVKLSRRRGNVVVSRRELLEEELNAVKQETLAKIAVGEVVTGAVKNVTSYGAFVDLGGIDGLIHVTDISFGRIKDPSEALTPGQEVTAKVIRFDPEKERVSLSLKDMQPDPWQSVVERYQQGARVTGKVASITDYGAFVELEEGVEGLIHISEMTWSKRLKHPSKVLSEGQDVESVILKVQPDQRRISLSLKQLEADPWESIGDRFALGSIVEGRVRNVTSYGVFVELEEGVDGLVHVSDLSWDSRVRNPKDVVKKGQTLRAVVLNVDDENRRMSLGVKQLEPDVWETFFSTHAVGDVVIGRVTRQVKFGAFVELSPGVEGLCHNSEMPSRGRGRRGGLAPGKNYEFEIVRMDELDRRIGLRCHNDEPVEIVEAMPAPQL